MKAALSVVLAGLLATLPLKQVLAQAEQQEAATVQQTASPDSSSHRLIRVPPVTDNTARLWQPLASEGGLADIFAEDGSIPVPPPMPKGAKIVLYALAALAIMAVVLGALLLFVCGGDRGGESC